ncbi:ornithine decarboxylase [Ixodes scapularis]
MPGGGFSNETVFVDETVVDVARKIIQIQETDDPFFVCDVREVERKVTLWKQELPRVMPFYAVKSCRDTVVLEALNVLGVNFDCSNREELQTAFDMGVDPNRIVLANTAKCTSDLRFAEQHGVALMTVDSEEELYKIKDPEARLMLRITTNEAGSQMTMNTKYGCTVEEAKTVLRTAQRLGLNVVGVSFHVGCAFKHPEIFAFTIESAKAVFNIGSEFGFKMSLLDIGGGFPGGLRKHDTFLKVCEAVRLSINRHFPESSGVRVIAEPGQFFVTSAFTLVTKVVGKRKRDIVFDGFSYAHEDVFINESKFNSIPRGMFQYLDVTFRPLDPPYDRPRNVLTTVWSTSGSPLDRVRDKDLLFDVAVDEWLLMDNMGAYSLVLTCGFNGSGFPPVKYIASAASASRVQAVLDSSAVSTGYGQLNQALNSRGNKKP